MASKQTSQKRVRKHRAASTSRAAGPSLLKVTAAAPSRAKSPPEPAPQTQPRLVGKGSPVKSETFLYVHDDGRRLEVRIEMRPNGRYALDLRTTTGKRAVVKAPGSKQGVKTIKEARLYAPLMLRELFNETKGPRPSSPKVGWKELVELHLQTKKVTGKYGPETLEQAALAIRRCLMIAAEQFGARQLSDIERKHVPELVVALSGMRTRTGKPFSRRYVRQHLMYLSGLYTWAMDCNLVESNPVSRHGSLPVVPKGSRRAWLEPSQAQALLNAMRSPHHLSPHLFWLVAMQLFTGMGPAEVFGLMVRDVDLDLMRIHVQRHPHRRLKNEYRERYVHIWPRLAEYLGDYLQKFTPPADGLLFPKAGVIQMDGAGRADAMWTDIAAGVAGAAKRAGITLDVTPYVMRHTFCSVRLQMVEELPGRPGSYVPVEMAQVARELGHGGERMVREIYGHIIRERYRQTELDFEAMSEQARAAKRPA